ncbi:unnamed protein product [Withania somnifera]
MVERRWKAVIWIRCFTRRRFSGSRKNFMGVALGGTSQMTVPRNSTVLCAAMVVDPAESTQRFKPDCRKWVIRFCISMRSSTEPTISRYILYHRIWTSGKPGSFYKEGGSKEARGLVKEGGKGRRRVENERHFLVPPSRGCLWRGVP